VEGCHAEIRECEGHDERQTPCRHSSLARTAALFASAGSLNIVAFWVYLAVFAAISALSLTILDPDFMQGRMRPGEQKIGVSFLPLIASVYLH